MRKVFLMLTTTLFSLEANAACSPTPDCASLGYKYSLEECGGAAIKCPNGDSYYCTSPLAKCNLADIYYSDKTCSSADNYDITKTVLGIVVYVTDGGLHGQIMSPWPVDANGNKSTSSSLYWSITHFDIPALPNYSSEKEASKDYDSCGNTDKIVAYCNAAYCPAAWAARSYAPTTGTKGKWCLPAAGLMNNIRENKDAMNKAATKVGNINFSISKSTRWTSTEVSASKAFVSADMSYGLGVTDGKGIPVSVFPVLEF